MHDVPNLGRTYHRRVEELPGPKLDHPSFNGFGQNATDVVLAHARVARSRQTVALFA
jgi:hypothetical protein